MESTRREFLKAAAITGVGAAVPALASATALATTDPLAAPSAPEIAAQTRGVGIYPGLPAEDFSPILIPDTSGTYRNLALLRPAFASSSYDYNLTAQLVTDGLIDTRLPDWVTTLINGEIQPKTERETVLNHFAYDVIGLPGTRPRVEIQLGGGTGAPEVDRIDLFVTVPDRIDPASLSFAVSVSEDGHLWTPAGHGTAPAPLPHENFPPDLGRGSHLLTPSIPLERSTRSRFFRVELGSADPAAEGYIAWKLGEIAFFQGSERVQIGGPYSFTSAWKSAGFDHEWVYVDLGGRFSFDRVGLHWIARAAAGSLQVSDDAQTWRDLQPLPTGGGLVDDIRLATPAEGRYVRVSMTQPATAQGYILSELQVFGRGGFRSQPKADAPLTGARATLAGGDWRLHRLAADTPAGEALSTPGYAATAWLLATVPATTLTSYLNADAIPDPNFGQNQLHISDSFFYADFWYRREFIPARPAPGQIITLNFEGINWKAEVFLNGKRLGNIDGGFMRGRFDVTSFLVPGKPNALALRVFKNATPGSAKQKTFEVASKNGGALGLDNPTFHASVGWDWIPTIRGRNTGIWGDVYLAETGAVTLEDPLVTYELPADHGHADLTLEVTAVNGSAKPVQGHLRGRFGTVTFEQPLQMAASSRQIVKLSPSTHAQLRLVNPELWWPTGYGEPHLYDVDLRFDGPGNKQHDRKVFKAGIRQMSFTEDGGNLRLFINGRRLIPKGGNWGFGESMLRYRAREYDAAVRYHREMNFNMIRNWVGQIPDDAFFEACDRHGVVVWQDFWLANPWDGPIPSNDVLFLANARDFLGRIRHHPSIGLYCGRNEGNPPTALEAGLRALLAELHPGIHYIPSSADDTVSGHGPYRALTAPNYFAAADTKFHSEMGAPAIPPIESVRAMMPASALWPQGLDWGLHDFTLTGAQGGTEFRALIDESYGGASTVEEWVALAQFLTYDTYRAMFEAQSRYRMGLLLWMSHPCWPCFVWQTYDFYLEPTAAYFACKKASEPLHIQWNALLETVEVVNYSAGDTANLTAEVEILNLDGTRAAQQTATLSAAEDSTSTPLRMVYPANLSPVHLLRLTLRQGTTVRSSNVYLRAKESADFRAIRTLPKVRIDANTTVEQRGQRWFLTTQLRNTGAAPALLVRLQAVRERTRDRILPAIFDDNFITLMPGETRTVTTELEHADTRGEKPAILVGGFNVA